MRSRPSNRAKAPAPPPIAIVCFRVGPYAMGIEAEALRGISRDHELSRQEREGLAILSAHETFGVPTGPETYLLVLDPQGAAFRVDRVERLVVTGRISPLPRAFQGEERVWYRGLALVEGAILPILNPVTVGHEARVRAGAAEGVSGPAPNAPYAEVRV